MLFYIHKHYDNFFHDFRSNALSFYQQGGNQEKLAECYYMIEDYDAYAKLALNFPDDHHLLPVSFF